jgi:alpha-glucosidase (family GH31 glycosyl hydrolase)
MPWKRWLSFALVVGCAQGSAHPPLRVNNDDEAAGEDAGYVPITDDASALDASLAPDASDSAQRDVILQVPGGRLRVTPYGEHIVRLQWSAGDFDRDDRFDIVERHDWPGAFVQTRDASGVRLDSGGVRVVVAESGAVSLSSSHGATRLSTLGPALQSAGELGLTFVSDPFERFTGLGHGYFGRVEALELSGSRQAHHYGTDMYAQAPLLVPFYLSSRGYGVLVNSTFDASFAFRAPEYGLSLDPAAGQLDVFYIDGEDGSERLARVLERYTELSGPPRLPPRAMFGLALSDKGAPEQSSAAWWQAKVAAHRAAGYPLDHLVNDNRWRAGGGERCASRFDWDPGRYPDPAAFASWRREQGLLATVDFNRCIAKLSDGWQPSFNLPGTGPIEYGDSSPDLTRPEVQQWWWQLVRDKVFAAGLGDALWVDEFDEEWSLAPAQTLADGRSWAEVKNGWFGLIARTLGSGWERDIGDGRRPFVWVRGASAGGQRWATLWSGDIAPTFAEMALQIRGMQAAGLAGFPFWGHDAGGYDASGLGDADFEPLYQSWALAMGVFTPYWKPHGIGPSRWPLDRSALSQLFAHRYAELRYALMPYLYGAAVEAAEGGLPIVRAMLLAHPDEARAWSADLQYYFGDALLVAPQLAAPDDASKLALWLPSGSFYGFWDDSALAGSRDVMLPVPVGELPLFVRAGSIVPMAPPAASTAAQAGDQLALHVWVGADGERVLAEDDGMSERWRSERRRTAMRWDDAARELHIAAAEGTFARAPATRQLRVVVHGLLAPLCPALDGAPISFTSTGDVTARWVGDPTRSLLELSLGELPVERALVLSLAGAGCTLPTLARYEAEAAANNGVAGNKPRASASSYVGSLDAAGRYVRFTITTGAGRHTLRLGWANGRVEDAVRTLRIDGAPLGTVQFAAQGSWQRFVASDLPDVELTAGTHTVEIATEAGQAGTIDIDYLDVTGG